MAEMETKVLLNTHSQPLLTAAGLTSTSDYVLQSQEPTIRNELKGYSKQMYREFKFNDVLLLWMENVETIQEHAFHRARRIPTFC